MLQPGPPQLAGEPILQWAGNPFLANRAGQSQTGRSHLGRSQPGRNPTGRNSMRTDPTGRSHIGWNRRVAYPTTSGCKRPRPYQNLRRASWIHRLTRDNGIRSSHRSTGGAGPSRSRRLGRTAEQSARGASLASGTICAVSRAAVLRRSAGTGFSSLSEEEVGGY
jgi:hypothetical protein